MRLKRDLEAVSIIALPHRLQSFCKALGIAEFAYIRQVFSVMTRAHWHQYQVLTKRAERLKELGAKLKWQPHIWMGVSVENENYLSRIDRLRQVDAHVRFLSLEPLLGPLKKIDLAGIDWVIVGGESGPGARPIDPAWATDIRDQCLDAGVPFFFKQWGGVIKKRHGRTLDGRTWDEMPKIANMRDGPR